jgi:hypothetical protein
MTAGIFITYDFTLSGMLSSEAKNYKEIFEELGIDKVIVYDFGRPGKFNHILEEFEFEFEHRRIRRSEDFHLLDDADVMFGWLWRQLFEKSMINDVYVENYKALSYYTNQLKRKVFFRLCDVRHFMSDYKELIKKEISDGFFRAVNGSKIFSLEKTERIDYTLCRFVCNGSREISDWSTATLQVYMPFLPEDLIKSSTVYLSDDILFRYSIMYDKFSHLSIENKTDGIYHVGNLNSQKIERFTEVLSSELNATLRLNIGSSGKVVSDLKLPATIIRKPLYGEKIFEEINSFKYYLFIGNGDADIAYLNKTLYDCSISRTIFLVYRSIDINGVFEPISEYYFEDSKSLKQLMDKLKNDDYEEHLKKQRDFLLANLSTEKIEL